MFLTGRNMPKDLTAFVAAERGRLGYFAAGWGSFEVARMATWTGPAIG